jgi:hypothetical protein
MSTQTYSRRRILLTSVLILLYSLNTAPENLRAANNTQLIPVAPGFSFDNIEGWAILPPQGNVIYRIDGTVVSSGHHYFGFGSSITITVGPANGYYFPSEAITEWSHVFNELIPDPPIFINSMDNDAYSSIIIIPYYQLRYVTYRINGVSVCEGEHYFSAGDTVTVIAESTAGFQFPGSATTGWTHTFKLPTPISPIAPSFSSEHYEGLVYFPRQENVIYYLGINGVNVKVPDYYDCYSINLGDTATVTAEPAPGYYFPSGTITGWTCAFTELHPPDPPTFIDPKYSGDEVIASLYYEPYIRWRINGKEVCEGWHYFKDGDTVVVTIETCVAGCHFPSGAVTQWTHTFSGGDSNRNGAPDWIERELGLVPSAPNNGAENLEINIHTPVN